MPELFDVACHFDDISISDAYTGTHAFKGQFSSFEESSPDGTTSKKRTLSVKPGTAIPARRTISFLSEVWIVGDGNVDGIYDRAIRTAYWMKKSTGLVTRKTPAQLCNNLAGVQFHASRNYLKDTVNGVSDTEYDPFWDVFTALNEGTAKGHFLLQDSKLVRVRGCHDEASGFTLAQCDELDAGALVSVSITTGNTYNPITDTYSGTSSTVTGVLMEASKFYRYATKADEKYNSGDMTLILAVSQPAGTLITIGGVTWRVQNVQAELDGYALHIRRP